MTESGVVPFTVAHGCVVGFETVVAVPPVTDFTYTGTPEGSAESGRALDPGLDVGHGAVDGPDPSALTGRRPEVLELEERQAELEHPEDQQREHAHDQGELDRCGALFAVGPRCDLHPMNLSSAGSSLPRPSPGK